MITRITKDNRAKYVKLFDKATEALKRKNSAIYQYEYIPFTKITESDYVVDTFYVFDVDTQDYILSSEPFNVETTYYVREDFAITSLEEYFQNIEELFELDPKLVRLPLDEDPFEIDLDTRQINIPAAFKKSGLGVQGDDMAAMIYFKCDRFFDATDLNETFIVIQWEAPNGKKMASPAYYQDIDSETDKLIFGWAITNSMTTMPGTLRFSVAFLDGHDVNDEGDELSIKELTYRLGTLTSSIMINAGLNIASQGVIAFEDKKAALESRIKNSSIFDKEPAQAPLATLKEYRGFDWQSEKTYHNIFEELLDDSTTEKVETGLTALAVSPNAGLISYEWYRNGAPIQDAKGAGAVRYLPVTYAEPAHKEAIYFIKESLGNNYRHFDEGKDRWISYDGEGNEIINPNLYERVAFFDLPEDIAPGRYTLKITNKEGRRMSTMETPGAAIIPGPTAISKVEIDSNNIEILEEGEGKFVTLTSAVAMDKESDYVNLKYQWYCDGVAVEGANDATHDAITIGDYTLKVENHWNKAVSAEVTSNNTIKIYFAAITPTITKFEAVGDKIPNSELYKTGAKLKVEFNPITQAQAKQYVRWMTSDIDIEEDLNDTWEFIKDEDGNFVEGAEFIANVPGDYKAVVYNYISDANQAFAETANIIQVVSLTNE